jgi:N,N'-diacetyllegionaminate synthase
MKIELDVRGRKIGPGHPAFIIAELGINHNGDPDIAKKMIDEVAKTGADAVKFQTYTTDTFVAKGNPYYEIFRQAEMSGLDVLREMKARCEDQGVIFFSSATDSVGLDILGELDVPLLKFSSANITNKPLFDKAARTGLPMIISSGSCTLGEVASAVDDLEAAGAEEVGILKCTSVYPTPNDQVNLRGMATLKAAFDCPIGFSDHTLGSDAAIAAVALGATIIEKHFTLDRSMEGHDHHFSATPEELSNLVTSVRAVETMQGSSKLGPCGEEVEFRKIGRRCVTAATDISANTEIQPDMVAVRRPSGAPGISPANIEVVIGRTVKRNISEGEGVAWQDI